jgi:hypothetical protein
LNQNAQVSQRLLASLEEMASDVDKVPETKASRTFRIFFEQRGDARGKRAPGILPAHVRRGDVVARRTASADATAPG